MQIVQGSYLPWEFNLTDKIYYAKGIYPMPPKGEFPVGKKFVFDISYMSEDTLNELFDHNCQITYVEYKKLEEKYINMFSNY